MRLARSEFHLWFFRLNVKATYSLIYTQTHQYILWPLFLFRLFNVIDAIQLPFCSFFFLLFILFLMLFNDNSNYDVISHYNLTTEQWWSHFKFLLLASLECFIVNCFHSSCTSKGILQMLRPYFPNFFLVAFVRNTQMEHLQFN